MRSRYTASRGWPFLLLAGLFLRAPLAVGQEPLLPPQPQLTPDVSSRLAEAAKDSTLAPWQRDFMLEVAQGRPERAAVEPSLALPDLGLPSAGSAAEDGAWTAVPPPLERSGHTAIYDPVRDRMVVFGGWDGGCRNDIWALSLAGSPPTGRLWHTAIYDPVRDRLVVFGGWDGGCRNDVWTLSFSGSPAWSALIPAGSPPSGRYGHTAFYDPVRDRLVVFGGVDGSYRNDVWARSLAGDPVWSALAPAGSPPPGRSGHTATYDPCATAWWCSEGTAGTDRTTSSTTCGRFRLRQARPGARSPPQRARRVQREQDNRGEAGVLRTRLLMA